jgi:ABC-2 type transport system permease protein
MPIREKGYHSWDGELKGKGTKWLPIFLTGIKSVYRKKRAKLLFAFPTVIFLSFLLLAYALAKPELKIFEQAIREITSEAFFFNTFFTAGPLIFAMLLISFFAGAHLISGDLKFKSFTLYLARPLSKFDYIKGKFSIVLFYLLLFTLVPGLLLMVAKTIFTGQFNIPVRVFIGSLIFPIIVSFFFSSTILMFSSISKNYRVVVILFFTFYFLSAGVSITFAESLKNDYFFFLSIPQNIKQLGTFIFNTRPEFNAPSWISGAVLILLTLVFMAIMSWRLKRAEV